MRKARTRFVTAAWVGLVASCSAPGPQDPPGEGAGSGGQGDGVPERPSNTEADASVADAGGRDAGDSVAGPTLPTQSGGSTGSESGGSGPVGSQGGEEASGSGGLAVGANGAGSSAGHGAEGSGAGSAVGGAGTSGGQAGGSGGPSMDIDVGLGGAPEPEDPGPVPSGGSSAAGGSGGGGTGGADTHTGGSSSGGSGEPNAGGSASGGTETGSGGTETGSGGSGHGGSSDELRGGSGGTETGAAGSGHGGSSEPGAGGSGGSDEQPGGGGSASSGGAPSGSAGAGSESGGTSSGAAAGTGSGAGGEAELDAGVAPDVDAGLPDGGVSEEAVLYAYVADAEGHAVVLRADAVTGDLELVASHDSGILGFLAVDREGRRFFEGRADLAQVLTFDPLQPQILPGQSVATEGFGTHAELDVTGSYLFVTHLFEPEQGTYPEDPSPNGKLTFVSYGAGGFGAPQTFLMGPRSHQARVHPNNVWVYVPCVEANYVEHFVLDAALGTLTRRPVTSLHDPEPGQLPAGPRHLDFHPDGQTAYVLTENSSEIYTYSINPLTGALSELQVVPTIASGGVHHSADIHVSHDGRFVYASNRFRNEIAHLAVDPVDATLTPLGFRDVGGEVRSFVLHPEEPLMYVTDTSGSLSVWQIDPESGALAPEAQSELPPSVTGLETIRAIRLAWVEP